ncbi:hypothetical protein KEM54_003489 [Ascosphaera aggregata]|nr:hypothetical protein KEM54_003489 [Ascosphaera aggregata]
MAPPKPAETPLQKSRRRREERAAAAAAAEAARRAREVPNESMEVAEGLLRKYDAVYREHELLRAECDRRLKAGEGPHYHPFDARCNPSRNHRDAYVETSGFRNRYYPEKRFLNKQLNEALDNARRQWALNEMIENGEEVDAELQEMREIDHRIAQKVSSSNVLFYHAVWDTARSECNNVTALCKKFYWYEKRYKPSQQHIPSAAAIARRRQYAPDPPKSPPRKQIGTHGKIWGPWRIWSLDAISADEQRELKKSEEDYAFVKRETTVDIVCDNHLQWVKISNTNNHRIIRAMTEIGATPDDFTTPGTENEQLDEEDVGYESPTINKFLHDIHCGWVPRFLRTIDEDDELPDLLKFAVQFGKAAPVNRVRYKTPRIRFFCPKLEEGTDPIVDSILREIRKLGIDVRTTDSVAMRNAPDVAPRPFSTALNKMMPDPYKLLSHELNLDCTILIGLVSDITHLKNPPETVNYAPAIKAQIQEEKQHSLLMTQLFPIVKDRQLFCTYEAAERYCSIAATMATAGEMQRTALFLERWTGVKGREEANADEIESLSSDERRERLQKLSDYEIPTDLHLPVKIIEDTEDTISRAFAAGLKAARQPLLVSREEPFLAPMAAKIALPDINHSVFLYPWATGMMTVTSNRVTAKEIQLAIDRHMNNTGESLRGPMLWATDVARSYITKGADIERPRTQEGEKDLEEVKEEN